MRNRLHALCPYFAMFPEAFVSEHVTALTAEGDYLLDPFAGRGTTALQSLLMARNAVAVDINPVAFCISGAKTQIPRLSLIIDEIATLEARYRATQSQAFNRARQTLPPFFRRAFYYVTLNQLLFLRMALNWRDSAVHRFLAALVLGTLHGEMGRSHRYLSNQMPRTISPKPAYSLRYWRTRNLWPRKRNVFDILRREAAFRLSGEIPKLSGITILSDARVAGQRLPHLKGTITAVITSPPYYNVTNFEEDQWLRLWFLGSEPRATYNQVSKDDRHENKESYWKFLAEAWAGIAPLLRPEASIASRIGGKSMTCDELTIGLTQTLQACFSRVDVVSGPTVTPLRRRQTNAFRPGSTGCGFEVDLVFRVAAKG